MSDPNQEPPIQENSSGPAQSESAPPIASPQAPETSATSSGAAGAWAEPGPELLTGCTAPRDWTNKLTPLLAILVLVLIGFRFAEPVGDGDLFWQMAYGRQLLEHHTLIPDHTIYSWSDAHNDTIYCAWVAEIFYYLLHQIGGLTIIFAFRYFVIAGAVALAASYARKIGWLSRPEFWLGATTFCLSSYVGTIIKPELFSFGYMSLVAWLLYRGKLADARNENVTRYFAALPILMCLWANSHGVYVFGMVGIALFTAGETLNYLMSRPIALKPRNFAMLWATLAVSCLTMCLTPYFLKYPWTQIQEVLGIGMGQQSSGDKTAYATIAAHMTIFQTPAFHFHQYLWLMLLTTWGVTAYPLLREDYDLAGRYQGPNKGHFSMWFASMNFLILVLAVCAILTEHRLFLLPLFLFAVSVTMFRAYLLDRHVDLSHLWVNGWFSLLYVWYLRTTFYYPPFFLYSTMFLLANYSRQLRCAEQDVDTDQSELLPNRRAKGTQPTSGWLSMATGVVASGLLAFFVARGCHEAYYTPYASSWCGFGITYWNPVAESEFIAKYHPDVDKVYNDYDSGGWLIWRLWPKVKVMIDPRSFPFRHFYAEYINYERGTLGIDEFTQRFPEKADVSVASLKNTNLWRAYLRHPGWQAAWVGPSSVVFCRKGHVYPKDAMEFLPDRFDQINNSQKALQIFQFGIESGLLDYSWKILEVMRKKFHSPDDLMTIENLDAYKQCLVALQNKDVKAALEAQEKCRHIGLFFNQTMLNQLYAARMQELKQKGTKPNDPEYVQVFRRSERAARNEDPLKD